MDAWGLKFSNRVVEFQARIVPSEVIIMRNLQKVRIFD